MSATVGIITAVVAGMILINIAIRRDYCTYLSEKRGIPVYKKKGLIPEPQRFSIATATVASEAIEPLPFHFSIMALAVLIISTSATIKLDVFVANFWPFSVIMAVGIAWMVFCAVFLAPRIFQRYWFERGITEFGMQTGGTAIGLMLLRVVDPLYKTDTAKAFGFKQMIYEPFLGGGFITAFAPKALAVSV